MLLWYEQDKTTAVIKFYANIEYWYNNAGVFTSLFEALDSKYSTIIVRAHCYGGSVYEGNAIYNCIAGANARTICRIEGVSMSMFSIIMLAFDEIEMCENSILMIHEPSAWVEGNEKDLLAAAKTLRIMKANAAKAYAKASGKTVAAIQAEYFDGSDHNLSAEEALAEGFITKIIPGIVKNVKALPIAVPGEEQEEPYNYAAIYNMYQPLLEMEDEGQQEYKQGQKVVFPKKKKAPVASGNTVTSKSNIKMKKELIEQLGLKGVNENTPDDQFAAAVKAHYEAKGSSSAAAQAPAAQPAAATGTTTDAKASAETVIAAVEKITGKTYEPAMRTTLLEVGEKAGIAALTMTMQAMQPTGNTAPAATPATPAVVTMINNNGNANPAANGDRANWDFNMWNEKDPKSLAAMAKNPATKAQYIALYKAEYNVEPDLS